MWRSKKFIVIALLATVLLVGSIGGIALAADEEDSSQPDTILDRVAEILVEEGVDITSEQLEDAFTEAQSEMRDEAMKNRLQNLVDQGKLSQDEADEYLEWQQARPDVSFGFGFRGDGGFRGHGGMRGFGGMHGFGGLCPSAE
ncbi:hypothetical protein ACFLXU_05080 [Chloroflexota bacterium]